MVWFHQGLSSAARLSLGLQSPEGSLRAGGFFSAYSRGCGRKFPSLANMGLSVALLMTWQLASPLNK